MVIRRGDIWWANLPEPRASEPGYRRPVLVVQSDTFSKSGINTVIVAVITSNTRLADAPGNVLLRASESDLRKESVVNVSQVLTLDRRYLTGRAGRVSTSILGQVDTGLRLVLSL